MKEAKHLVLILSFIFLSGCFDIEQEVVINRDGSGSISLSVISNPEIGTSIRDERVSGVIKPEVQVRNVIKSKKFYHIESVEFGSISDLILEEGRITVEIFGLRGRNKSASFTHTITLEEAEPGSEDFFSGHYYSYSIELPGEITTVHPLIVNDIEIEPVVSLSTATWDIPLNMVIEQGNLNIKIDFIGELEFSESLQSQFAENLVKVKEKLQSPKGEKEKQREPVLHHPITGITANLSGSSGRIFVAIDIMVETTSEDTRDELIVKEYQIRNALIFYFRGRTLQEIATREFQLTARDTVRSIINSIVETVPVDTVFFTTFLIQ